MPLAPTSARPGAAMYRAFEIGQSGSHKVGTHDAVGGGCHASAGRAPALCEPAASQMPHPPAAARMPLPLDYGIVALQNTRSALRPAQSGGGPHLGMGQCGHDTAQFC